MPKTSVKWTPLLSTYPFSDKINLCSRGAETLYTRLLAQSDANGNFYGEVGLVASKLYRGLVPVDEVASWMNELVSVGLVSLYSIPESTDVFAHINNVFKVASKQQIGTIYPPGSFDTSVSKKVDEQLSREAEFIEIAGRVIEFINKSHQEAGTATVTFSKTKTNWTNIVARLRDGAIEEELMLIVAHKAAVWLRDPISAAWVNPTTLFRPTKFENNLNAARVWKGNAYNRYYRGQGDGTDYDTVMRSDSQ